MRRWLKVLAIGLAVTAVGVGVSIAHARREAPKRVLVAASCLKTIGNALKLGEAARKPAIAVESSPAPATRPTTEPTTRTVVLGGGGCHDSPGNNVLFADGNAVFQQTPLGGANDDNIYTATTQPADPWQLLAGGKCVILLRHAKTDDATKDAETVNLADRATQRNLSAAGVAQAKHIGEIFRDKKIPVGRVLSSQFARCQETATLAFGHVTADPILNSLKDSEAQVREMLKLLQAVPDGGNLVLVTHQANLASTTKLIPEMGDAVIVQPQADGTFQVIGVLELAK